MLGVRLAAGGNRSGWLRIATVAAGIGLTVAVLLIAASVGHVRDAQGRREVAQLPAGTDRVAGADPLYLRRAPDTYRGQQIQLSWVRAGGPRAPVPPGLDRIPGPGEAMLSPALARLLASPDGVLLRPRYAARVVGTIGPAGLPDGPGQLAAYLGSGDLQAPPTYRFGQDVPPSAPLPPLLWMLLVVGVVVLLFPTFVLIAAVSRLSAVDRQRRLAAIRLVGAGSGQVRRVAAGEALAGALLGLAVGGGLFLAARRLVEWEPAASVASYGGGQPFVADVVPAWPLVLLVAVVVPALAVLTSLNALRGVLTEPLGVVRTGGSAAPRLLWRLLPATAGLVLLVLLGRAPQTVLQGSGTVQLVAGAVLVLLAVPVVLPWLVHRVVHGPWPRDRTPALQLATRRLQLDSGPPARLLGGLAVTLTGAVALSGLLVAAQDRFGTPYATAGRFAVVQLPSTGAAPADLTRTLRAVRGVTGLAEVRRLSLAVEEGPYTVTVGPCPALRALATLPSCVDGRWYHTGAEDLAGRTAQIWDPAGAPSNATVRIPAHPQRAGTSPDSYVEGGLLATPGAVRGVPPELTEHLLVAGLDGHPDTLEGVRNAVVAAGWRAEMAPDTMLAGRFPQTRDYEAIRRGLLAGALLLLVLGAAALLAACVQQVRDARRSLAALAAVGVPRAVLARAVGWQNAIPLVLTILLADGAGILLGLLLLPVAAVPVAVDWQAVGLMSAAALVAGAAVTVLTLPTVWAAARPGSLRTE